MSKEMPSEREIVLDVLLERERTGRFAGHLIRNAQDRYVGLTPAQRSFIKRLAQGTIEKELELDHSIKAHLSRPGTKIKKSVLCLLRMSIYQVLYMDSVPDFAICSEAVSIAKKRGLAESAGFINGMLRTVCREQKAKKEGGFKAAGTAIIRSGAAKAPRQYVVPDEIMTIWEEDYGKETAEGLLQSLSGVRPVCVRIDARLSEEEKAALKEDLAKAGCTVSPGRYLADCLCLENTGDIRKLPGFAEGLFTVQDESSQLCAKIAAAGIGDAPEVLDLCAAPGGKSLAIAALLPGSHIRSFDVSLAKTDLIRAGIRRLKCDNIEVAEKDATLFDPSLEESADLVLCDVPCSGLGVIARKRDIAYNVDRRKIRSLCALQKKILQNAVRYVKNGGTLIYSTCTINRMENDRQAEYIRKELGLVPKDLAPFLPEGLAESAEGSLGSGLQIFPHLHHMDGFYIARFQKK